MPDKRTHRGPHPDDARLFAAEQWPQLRHAAGDLSWLLTRGYASVSALKIVGDRYALDQRQRNAVSRSACSDEARDRRAATQVEFETISGKTLLIDGYNVLTTIEAALAGGVLLMARDGCLRDIASVHGTWRKVHETLPAIELLGRCLSEVQPKQVTWLLDSPVSNSGRLKTMLREIVESHDWPWDIRLVANPDRELCATVEIVATADSAILDRCRHWVNLARLTVERCVPEARIVDLSKR